MLYDKRWDKKTIVHPSYEGMVSWLEMQKAQGKNRWYFYFSPGHCLLAHYLKALGSAECPLDPTSIIGMKGLRVVSSFPWTYRAALRRARHCAMEGYYY